MNNDKMADNKNKSDKIKNKVDIKKYTDPTGLSAKNLDLGLWFASHMKKIMKAVVVILSILSASFVVYAFYGYIYYFTFGREQEKIMEQTSAIIDIASYRLNNAAKPLEILSVKALNSSNGYDLVAKIKNPNSRHYATISYCFVLGSDRKCSSSFILPGEEKLIILPKQTSSETVNNISFTTDTINWQKLNARSISDWETYKNEHLNFFVSDLRPSSYGNNLNYLEFNISNNSAYSYYEVPLNIFVRNGDSILAVNRYVIPDFKSREQKNIRLYWPDINSYGNNISIVPDLNIIDSGVYKPYNN